MDIFNLEKDKIIVFGIILGVLKGKVRRMFIFFG